VTARRWAMIATLLAATSIALSAWLYTRSESNADQIAELSVSNCTTINENTEAVTAAALALQGILQALIDEGAVPEDAEVRIMVPEPKDCDEGVLPE
jgi:hypothetical protein